MKNENEREKKSRDFGDYYILKASGEKELFDPQKLIQSLTRVKASARVINNILDEIKKKEKVFKTARDIYKFAFCFLKKYNRGIAGRYNLKNALYELGPTGYPFEKFVAQIFQQQGFEVKLDRIATGRCVSHEIDAVVRKGDEQYLVECKFHNKQGPKTDVKIPLYIKARFDDIKEYWAAHPKQNGKYHQAWIFTNTKFTWNAILYAKCVDIKLVGWSYPDKDNLAQLIDNLGLHPITTLTTLNRFQKKILVENGIVLCKQICKEHPAFEKLNLSKDKISKIILEAQAVCKLPD